MYVLIPPRLHRSRWRGCMSFHKSKTYAMLMEVSFLVPCHWTKEKPQYEWMCVCVCACEQKKKGWWWRVKGTARKRWWWCWIVFKALSSHDGPQQSTPLICFWWAYADGVVCCGTVSYLHESPLFFVPGYMGVSFSPVHCCVCGSVWIAMSRCSNKALHTVKKKKKKKFCNEIGTASNKFGGFNESLKQQEKCTFKLSCTHLYIYIHAVYNTFIRPIEYIWECECDWACKSVGVGRVLCDWFSMWIVICMDFFFLHRFGLSPFAAALFCTYVYVLYACACMSELMFNFLVFTCVVTILRHQLYRNHS